jgi:hypothetical protein
MTVFVLMGEISYEPGTVLGVYSSRETALAAAQVFETANQAMQYPTEYVYFIHEVGVDAPACQRLFEGEQLEVE